MFGRYSRALAEFAREKAAELRKKDLAKKEEKEKKRELLHTYRGKWTTRITRVVSFVWQSTFAKIGEDWVFLAILGVIMALISYVIDYGAAQCSLGTRFTRRKSPALLAVQTVVPGSDGRIRRHLALFETRSRLFKKLRNLFSPVFGLPSEVAYPGLFICFVFLRLCPRLLF